VISTGSELYKLTIVDIPTTTNALALLNEDECAALKLDEFYLNMELVTDNNKALYEEEEINTIIKKESFEGASNKLNAIAFEISKIENDIANRQNLLTNAILNYATSYLKMIESVNAFNTRVK